MEEKTGHIYVAYKNIGGWNVTARADGINELMTRTQALEKAFGSARDEEPPMPTDDEIESVMDDSPEEYCSRHKVTMKERDGRNGKFYSHYIGKYPDGSWCNGK